MVLTTHATLRKNFEFSQQELGYGSGIGFSICDICMTLKVTDHHVTKHLNKSGTGSFLLRQESIKLSACKFVLVSEAGR